MDNGADNYNADPFVPGYSAEGCSSINADTPSLGEPDSTDSSCCEWTGNIGCADPKAYNYNSLGRGILAKAYDYNDLGLE